MMKRFMVKSLLVPGLSLVLMLGAVNATFALTGDKVEFTGYLGLRYDYGNENAVLLGPSPTYGEIDDEHVLGRGLNADLYGTYHVTEKTKVCFFQNFYNEANDQSSDKDRTASRVWAEHSMGQFDFTAGTFKPVVGYGLVKSDADYCAVDVKGVEATYHFNEALQARVFSGTINTGIYDLFAKVYGGQYPLHAGSYDYAEVAFKLSSDANLKGAYHQNRDTEFKVSEIGADFKLGEEVGALVSVAKSNWDDNDMAYMAELRYGRALPMMPNQYDLFVAYHENPATATFDGGTNNDCFGGRQYDFKGLTVGGHYTISKNVLFTTIYETGDQISTGDDYSVLRMQIDFLIL